MKKFLITVNGQTFEVEVQEVEGTTTAVRPAATAPVVAAPIVPPVAVPAPKKSVSGTVGGNTVNAPMPGKILAVKVKVGDSVKRGTVLLILEAMKMQNEIVASADGTVVDIAVSAGQNVSAGQAMIVLQ